MRSPAVALSAVLLAAAGALAACSQNDVTTGPQPTGVSVVPPTSAPATPATTPAPSGPTQPKQESSPSVAQSEKVTTIEQAVAVAESVVADSTVVEISSDDDDGQLVWEATVRAGDNGREVRINGADGTVLSNESDPLHESQLGNEPTVDASRAIKIAEKEVAKGAATDVELTRESDTRIWEVSVEVAGGAEWELWIDASTGEVLRKERD